MKITEVKIRRVFDRDPLRAIASVTFDREVAIHDIKLVHAKDRWFVVMPSTKMPDGTFRDIAHPITQEVRDKIERAVIEAYCRALTDTSCVACGEEVPEGRQVCPNCEEAE